MTMIAALLANLRNTVIVGAVLALIFIAAYLSKYGGQPDQIFWQAIFRYQHVQIAEDRLPEDLIRLAAVLRQVGRDEDQRQHGADDDGVAQIGQKRRDHGHNPLIQPGSSPV